MNKLIAILEHFFVVVEATVDGIVGPMYCCAVTKGQNKTAWMFWRLLKLNIQNSVKQM